MTSNIFVSMPLNEDHDPTIEVTTSDRPEIPHHEIGEQASGFRKSAFRTSCQVFGDFHDFHMACTFFMTIFRISFEPSISENQDGNET